MVRVTALDIQVSLRNQMANFSKWFVFQYGSLWEPSICPDLIITLPIVNNTNSKVANQMHTLLIAYVIYCNLISFIKNAINDNSSGVHTRTLNFKVI